MRGFIANNSLENNLEKKLAEMKQRKEDFDQQKELQEQRANLNQDKTTNR